MIRTRHGNIPILVLRIAGMYTDHCDSETLAQQMQRIDQRSLIGRVFPGDTSHGQAFVHLDDLCDAFALAIERRKRLPSDLTVLIGEPETPSYAQLQDGFARLMHVMKADRGAWYARNKLTSPAGVTPKQRSALDEREQGAVRHQAAMMERLHKDTLWAHFVVIFFGVWLIFSPSTLDYTGEAAMTASEIASGVLVALFGTLSLGRRFGWAQWANVLVGMWLLFAPLVFWTASPAAYLNDTLVGSLVIALAILVPQMPGMRPVGMALGPDIPPGWDWACSPGPGRPRIGRNGCRSSRSPF